MGKRIPAPHAWQVTLHRWWGAGEEGHADADADADADAHRAWQTAGEGAREGAPPHTHTDPQFVTSGSTRLAVFSANLFWV